MTQAGRKIVSAMLGFDLLAVKVHVRFLSS
jgi:hypothetical protein